MSRAAGASTLAVMDWSKCWLADWGALEIAVDPFTNFKDGKVNVRTWWAVDVAFERPDQIAYVSALT